LHAFTPYIIGELSAAIPAAVYRSRTGELLGFERTATLSTRPAESIALAAQNFGQEDDITVLTLSRASRQALPKTASPLTAPLPS
jgi:hypothetical protein